MGQTADRLTEADTNFDARLEDGSDDEVTAEDIEQTRNEMTGTIAAIGDKINPHVIAEHAKDVASDTTQHAKEAAVEVVEHAKESVTEVVQHAKESVTDMVHQLREALPEAAANAARHAVSSAVDETKQAISKGFNTSKHALQGAVGSAQKALGGLADSAKTTIDGTASEGGGVTVQGITMTITKRISENPTAAILAGLGLYLLFRNSSKTDIEPSRSTGPSEGYSNGTMANGTMSNGTMLGKVGDKIGEAAEDVRRKAGDMASQIQDTASGVAGRVQDAAGNIGTQVQEKAHQGGDAFLRMLNDNPLAVGGIAFGIAVLAGLAIPSSEPEKRLMGPARDNLMEKAQGAVQDVAQNLGNKVQQAVDNAGEAVTSMKESVTT
jgi:hypothetical protein